MRACIHHSPHRAGGIVDSRAVAGCGWAVQLAHLDDFGCTSGARLRAAMVHAAVQWLAATCFAQRMRALGVETSLSARVLHTTERGMFESAVRALRSTYTAATVGALTVVGAGTVGCSAARFRRNLGSQQKFSFFRLFAGATRLS